MKGAENLIFLGPPGAGKGTQAAQLAESRSLPHVSTGDLFRMNLKEETPLGLMAKGFMDRGLLVPDDVVIEMVRERLQDEDTEVGFILDGFPRTRPQAEALGAELKRLQRTLTAVVSFEIDDRKLVERLTGRLTCKTCGSVFHRMFRPPAEEGVCDQCGEAALYTRSDDTVEAVTARLKEYRDKTAPLLAYYADKGLLREVDASQPVDQVSCALESLLEAR